MVGWLLFYPQLQKVVFSTLLITKGLWQIVEVVTFGAKRCQGTRANATYLGYELQSEMDSSFRWAFHGISYDFLNHVKYSCVMLFLCFFSFFTMFHPCFTFRFCLECGFANSICWFIPGPTNGWVPTSRKDLNVQRAKWHCVTSPMQPPCAMRRTLRPQAPIFFGGLLVDLLPSLENCMYLNVFKLKYENSWCQVNLTTFLHPVIVQFPDP